MRKLTFSARNSPSLGHLVSPLPQLQAYFLVADDMMDASITRRGQPCWYKVDGVANIAINDAFMLEGAIYFLLKKHFRPEPYYVDLLELFHDVRLLSRSRAR
jgi:geranylgeranyl pyrophosphate synthase